MPTIKCIKNPVIRPMRVAIIVITDRSNGEHFIVGKSNEFNQLESDTLKVYLLIEQNCAFPLKRRSEKNV